jgi:lysozyme
MKKVLISIISPLLLLSASTYFLPQPSHKGMQLKAAIRKTIPVHPDTMPKETFPSGLDDEFKYYFDRHNVMDEGYEMVAAFANGKRLEIEPARRLTVWNVGSWLNRIHEGTALTVDTAGFTIIATFDADTIKTGLRIDSLGTYLGDFTGTCPHGHGAYVTDDSYFEGHWVDNTRDGFGIQLITPEGEEPRLQVGEWKKNRFWGERMKYTSERIYGIDIARYQHGKGRHKYPINWKQLGINYLGRKTHKNVHGKADYPVSFIFIKSTEGTSIRNKFYVSDYAAARKQGIPIGAYHFFSLKTSGAAQAQHFINNTLFKHGDLPPVLDVEPSDAQIKAAGGPEKMFQQIRVWLQMVKRRCGVSPILYINQMFINKYLGLAPDIKRDYDVWIARYGEYKPDVRLAFWQLCPDGRVKGIQGDVDINVFNGYKSQFQEFVATKSIK